MLYKKHILKNKNDINKLFQKGEKQIRTPIMHISMVNNNNKVFFSVSKKHIFKSNERNKIKRQMRAIYFENHNLFLSEEQSIIRAFIYIGNTKVDFSKIKESMIDFSN